MVKYHSSTTSIHIPLHPFIFPVTMILWLIIAVQGGDRGVDLIHETCKTTRHYRLCVSSLQSDSASSNASDARALARIMAGVGIANATATKAYISSLLHRGGGGETGKRLLLLRDCADKYSYAGEALRASIPDMEAEMYDYAYVHVTAAADYPNACHDGFRRHPGLAYPVQLGVREEGLRRICDVLLGMLDSLLPSSS